MYLYIYTYLYSLHTQNINMCIYATVARRRQVPEVPTTPRRRSARLERSWPGAEGGATLSSQTHRPSPPQVNPDGGAT